MILSPEEQTDIRGIIVETRPEEHWDTRVFVEAEKGVRIGKERVQKADFS